MVLILPSSATQGKGATTKTKKIVRAIVQRNRNRNSLAVSIKIDAN
jgi:hypothetical protein